jgi:hypothetical protein
MSKKNECFERLRDLIEDVVLIDLEEQIDEIFAVIAKEKSGKEEYEDELNELHEMRKEFKLIIEDIDNKELESEECKELYDEILKLISEEE